MFKCAMTGEFSKPNEKAVRLIVKRRKRVYMASEQIPKSKRDGDFTGDDTIVGHGWEVVHEVNVTLDGLRVWCGMNPDDTENAERYASLVRAAELRRRASLREGIKDGS